MIETFLVPIIAAIAAGICWNSFGIYNAWRKTGSLNINEKKLAKNAIIGIVVGIIAYGFQTVNNPEAIVAITTPNLFFAAVAGWFPIIIIVEKLFATRSKDLKKSN